MPSPIQNYIEQRKEEFERDYISENNSGQKCWSVIGMSHENVQSFHTETLTTVLKVVREVVGEVNHRKLVDGEFSTKSYAYIDGVSDERYRIHSSLPDIT